MHTSNTTEEIDEKVTDKGHHTAATNRFNATAKCLCLAICYAATCGGVSTLTGTGTNLVFLDSVTV